MCVLLNSMVLPYICGLWYFGSCFVFLFVVFFVKQKTAYEMRISDWSSDECSSDLDIALALRHRAADRDAIGRLARAAQVEPRFVPAPFDRRAEERRVGKECVRTCRSR